MAGEILSFNANEAQLKAVRKHMTDLIARLKNSKSAYRGVELFLLRDVIDHFSKEEGTNKRWEPLKSSTIKNRRQGKGIGSAKILQDTGRLRASFETKSYTDSAVVGTNLKYASTHEKGARKGAFGADRFGRPIPWGDIPARRFMFISDGMRVRIINYLSQFIFKGEL